MKKILIIAAFTGLSLSAYTQELKLESAMNSNEAVECFSFLDRCVKECNGMIVSTNNIKQLTASFTNNGYSAVTVEIVDAGGRKKVLYETEDIQWGHLTCVNSADLTFQYSCICIQFAEGFYPSRKVHKSGASSIEDRDPYASFKNEEVYSESVEHESKKFSIIVKKENAAKCVETIRRLYSIGKRNYSSLSPSDLTKNEEWQGYSSAPLLYTFYTDKMGVKQGLYEVKDKQGIVMVSGNFRDNVKVGTWITRDEGGSISKIVYTGVDDECFCHRYH